MTAAEEVARGVYVLGHRVVEGKNGVVIGARGALAIDCGSDASEGRANLDVARQHTDGPIRLAMTHCHGDHALGSAPFRGVATDVYTHETFPANLRRHLALRAARAGNAGDDEGESLAWPTVTFSDALRLDVGDRTLRLLATPGHSADSVCVYLEEARILFGGDTVVTCIVPAFGDGDSRAMQRSLERLTTIEPELLVPGHGPMLRGAAPIREHLTWMARYIGECRDAVEGSSRAGRAERDGWIEVALAAAPYERLVGSHLPVEPHDNRKRHRATIAKLVDEALSAPG